jgi:hypothetical protein
MSPDSVRKPDRVWTNPDSGKDKPSLICLKRELLCLAIVPSHDLKKTAAALAAGGEVVAQNIPLDAIDQLRGEERDNTLSITYKQGESKTDSVTVTLVDSSQRDELLDALRVRLGPNWACERKQASRLSASLWPLGVTAGVALYTCVIYFEAQDIAAGKHLPPITGRAKTKLFRGVMRWAEGLIGTTGLLILGGVLVTLCILWLVYAVSHPPPQVTVTVCRKVRGVTDKLGWFLLVAASVMLCAGGLLVSVAIFQRLKMAFFAEKIKGLVLQRGGHQVIVRFSLNNETYEERNGFDPAVENPRPGDKVALRVFRGYHGSVVSYLESSHEETVELHLWLIGMGTALVGLAGVFFLWGRRRRSLAEEASRAAPGTSPKVKRP